MAKAKKEYENPLSKEDFVDGKPWWADLWDKGQLTKEQEKLILEGKSDLAKKIKTKAEQSYKDSDRYNKQLKAVETAETAIDVGSLALGAPAIIKGTGKLAYKAATQPKPMKLLLKQLTKKKKELAFPKEKPPVKRGRKPQEKLTEIEKVAKEKGVTKQEAAIGTSPQVKASRSENPARLLGSPEARSRRVKEAIDRKDKKEAIAKASKTITQKKTPPTSRTKLELDEETIRRSNRGIRRDYEKRIEPIKKKNEAIAARNKKAREKYKKDLDAYNRKLEAYNNRTVTKEGIQLGRKTKPKKPKLKLEEELKLPPEPKYRTKPEKKDTPKTTDTKTTDTKAAAKDTTPSPQTPKDRGVQPTKQGETPKATSQADDVATTPKGDTPKATSQADDVATTPKGDTPKGDTPKATSQADDAAAQREKFPEFFDTPPSKNIRMPKEAEVPAPTGSKNPFKTSGQINIVKGAARKIKGVDGKKVADYAGGALGLGATGYGISKGMSLFSGDDEEKSNKVNQTKDKKTTDVASAGTVAPKGTTRGIDPLTGKPVSRKPFSLTPPKATEVANTPQADKISPESGNAPANQTDPAKPTPLQSDIDLADARNRSKIKEIEIADQKRKEEEDRRKKLRDSVNRRGYAGGFGQYQADLETMRATRQRESATDQPIGLGYLRSGAEVDAQNRMRRFRLKNKTA